MNKKMFVGRDNDIDNLSNEIIHSNRGKTVIIYGQFRSGKTSLGKFLAAKIQERDNSFMVVDSGTVMSDFSISDIINEIVNSIIEGIKTKLGLIPDVLLEYVETDATEKNYIRYFTKFAKSLKVVLEKQMSNMRILILLDELGRFLEHNEASAFTELWKAIMALGAFDAILIGHDSITRVIQANNNAFGVMTLFHISYLAYEPSVRLITDPTAMTVNGEKHSRFIGKSIDYIWNQSGGNVFYLQHICKASVEFMNDWHRNVLNETYVQQAIKEYLNKKTPDDITLIGHSLFQSSDGWDGITDRDNKIVLDAITKTNHLKSGSNTESIVGYINESYQELALSSEQIQRVLFSLLSRKVVLKDDRGCFSIVAKFYSDYLNEYIIRPILPDR
jgi:Cdc6-like AAA superfamily ATPase